MQPTEDQGARSARLPGELGAALGTLASASAAPYGFTLSVWSSGAVLTHFRGAPNVGDVFLFISGALAGFAVVGLLAHRPLRASQYAVHGERERVLAGLLHWFSVGIAVGAVVLIAQIQGWVAWPLSMFAATSLYLLGAALQLAVVSSRRGGPQRVSSRGDYRMQ
jgi:hypothetical protein